MIIKSGTIKVDYKNLYDLVDEKFGIPVFQRFYDWKSGQVEQLLCDLEYAIENDCEMYLLDFIYYLDNNKYMIADGQQRLVSINLLLKAVNDYIDKNNLSITKVKLFDISYDMPACQKAYDTNFNSYICNPFKDVYCRLLDWVDDNFSDLEKIIKVLQTNIHVYLKKCENGDDAFVIFQQINTGGKPLNKDEIIKTAINQYADLYGIDMYGKMTNIKQSFVSYYKFVKKDPSSSIDNIAIIAFLKDYVTKDKATFKKFSDTLGIIKKLEDNPIYKIIGFINRAALVDVLNILAMKQIDTKTNKKYFDDVMLPLILLSIIVSIKKGNPSIINPIIKTVIELIKNDVSSTNISLEIAKYIDDNSAECKISFNDFNIAMGNPDVKLRGIKKAILILDVMISSTSGTVNVDKINLEHIYPQKPHNNWVTIGGWPTSKEDQKIWVDNIGNYMLLAEAVNKKIKNKYITDKVHEYNKIIPKDLILKTQMNTVDFVKFEQDKELYIRERCESISRLVRGFKFGSKIILPPSGTVSYYTNV